MVVHILCFSAELPNPLSILRYEIIPLAINVEKDRVLDLALRLCIYYYPLCQQKVFCH